MSAASNLLPIEKALESILSNVKPITDVEFVSLASAQGRILAKDQQSLIDVPPSDNSAMDGYAVCYDDLVKNEYKLCISQRIAAGHIGVTLEQGTAARIFTGASLPAHADTIIMQEDTHSCVVNNMDAIEVTDTRVRAGQHIRIQGQDISKGAVVATKGRCLQPQDIGLLASIGITELPVYRRLKVAVLSTGDELVEPGQPLADGKIYNSNRYTLMALLSSFGCEAIDGGIVPDNLDETCEKLSVLASSSDLVISSGGVSVGEEDYVKVAVETLGQLSLWKLNIKPGKPLAFGSVKDTPFFGLPGNPSSVFVTFAIIARPYLLALQGRLDINPIFHHAEADFEWPRVGKRQEYLRAKVITVDQKTKVSIYGNQSSGVLASMSWANALVVVTAGTTIKCGDLVKIIMLNELLS